MRHAVPQAKTGARRSPRPPEIRSKDQSMLSMMADMFSTDMSPE
jgi:hypothetical protein